MIGKLPIVTIVILGFAASVAAEPAAILPIRLGLKMKQFRTLETRISDVIPIRTGAKGDKTLQSLRQRSPTTRAEVFGVCLVSIMRKHQRD